MATLADLNKTLQEQNNLLDSVNKNTENTQEGIISLADKLGLTLAKQEREYEENKKKAKPASPSRLAQSGAMTGIFGLGGLLGGGALFSALFAGLGKIGKGGILALAGGYLADAVGDYIERGGGSEELADMARRAVTGGMLGSIFGFKFGLIGAALAAVIDEEGAKQLKQIGSTLGDHFFVITTLFEDLGITIPELEDVTRTVNDGLRGINAFLKGDMTTFIEEFGKIQITIGLPLLLLGQGKIRAVGAVLTALGLSFNFIEEELGPISGILIEGFALLAFGAYAFRKKILDFLRRTKPDLDKFDKPIQRPDKDPDKKPGRPLPTSDDILEERLRNRDADRIQENSFRKRLAKLFQNLKLPVTGPAGRVGAALMLGPLVLDAVTEQDPNVYGFDDLGRDILGVAEEIGKFLYKPVPSPGDGIRLREPGIEDFFRTIPISGQAIDEFTNMFGPPGQFMPQPGTGTVFAPQVDASSTSIDQSQSTMIKMDPHISPTNPFAIYDY